MDESRDFVKCLGRDMPMKILTCLNDPSDFVRTSAVSRSWREFVIANGLCKKLCLRMFPEVSSFDRVHETKELVVEPMGTRRPSTNDSAEWAVLEREHRVYASLSKELITPARDNCISDAIYASSTDNYPYESIKNTLKPSEKIGHRASYWSSKGASDPSAPETLIYELASDLCVITEIHVHPFQAYFQYGFPIYSAKALRFHMGYSKLPLPLDGEEEGEEELVDMKDFCDDNFVWTHSSPEFPMVQENFLQKFKLPKPVLCIGGIVRVELLGRVQTQYMDGLYYICINHVQVVGRPLSPLFDVEMIDERGKCTLKYNSARACKCPTVELEMPEAETSSRFQRFSESMRSWEQLILSTIRGAGPVMIEDYDSDYEYLD